MSQYVANDMDAIVKAMVDTSNIIHLFLKIKGTAKKKKPPRIGEKKEKGKKIKRYTKAYKGNKALMRGRPKSPSLLIGPEQHKKS